MITRENGRGYHFGLEVEYLLVEAETFRPLWHPDLTFEELNAAFEAIPVGDLPPLDGLELEPPHQKLMPFAVEGYHLPSPALGPKDLLPKGVEIRTPVCPSIERCLECLQELHGRMQVALGALGYRAVACSHHPVEDRFEGPQNKRRHDFWQWAMLAMTTYGPDVNVSLPAPRNDRLDVPDLHAKVNYYAPALDGADPGLAGRPRRSVGDPRTDRQVDPHLPPQRDRPGDRAAPRRGGTVGVQDLRGDQLPGRPPRLFPALASSCRWTRACAVGPASKPGSTIWGWSPATASRPRRSPSEPRKSWIVRGVAGGPGLRPPAPGTLPPPAGDGPAPGRRPDRPV